MWKVLWFYSFVEMTFNYLFFWCWTLKSPLGRYLSTALSPRSLTNPMGSVGGDSQTLHNQQELWDPNPILDHLKRWSQMILQYQVDQVVYFPHVMICNVISFQSTSFNSKSSLGRTPGFPEAQSFEHFLLKWQPFLSLAVWIPEMKHWSWNLMIIRVNVLWSKPCDYWKYFKW